MKSFSAILCAAFALGAVGALDVQAHASGPTVRIVRASGFSPADDAKLARATALLERVIASDEFRERVLEFSARGQPGFVQNRGLSNGQILEVIDSRPIELDLELYSASLWRRVFGGDGTVGYTLQDSPRIWMNRKFFRRFSDADVAGNLAHEWMHKLGFEHDFKRTARRPYSVPYGIGAIVVELAAALD